LLNNVDVIEYDPPPGNFRRPKTTEIKQPAIGEIGANLVTPLQNTAIPAGETFPQMNTTTKEWDKASNRKITLERVIRSIGKANVQLHRDPTSPTGHHADFGPMATGWQNCPGT